MRAIKQLAAVARMPAQLAALADNLARHLNAVTKAIEGVGWNVAQLQHGPRTVTVLLLGEGLEDSDRRPLFASVNVSVPAGEGSTARGYIRLQLPVAAGAWLVPVGGLVSDAHVGTYLAHAGQGWAAPLARLSQPIAIGVDVHFLVHRLP